MLRLIVCAITIIVIPTICLSQITKQKFEFQFEGHRLDGVLTIPDSVDSKGVVIIVHGSGRTNAVAEEWHLDVRTVINEAGYSTYMWDKIGCGGSEGTFDINQTVQNSSDEVVAAIHALQKEGIDGAEVIGLWGISRAGWINPLVINKYPNIKFWITVSGVDDKENFPYLLEKNLCIEGLSEDSIRIIVNELIQGYRLMHVGGSFDEYIMATQNLQKNSFWIRFTNQAISREAYENYQPFFMEQMLDSETGLQLYIENFGQLLSNIRCPVLALFGEKDMHVDWQKTIELYNRTLSKNSDLYIRTFSGCDHNLMQCETGGFYEHTDQNFLAQRCDGFLNTIYTWLVEMQ